MMSALGRQLALALIDSSSRVPFVTDLGLISGIFSIRLSPLKSMVLENLTPSIPYKDLLCKVAE